MTLPGNHRSEMVEAGELDRELTPRGIKRRHFHVSRTEYDQELVVETAQAGNVWIGAGPGDFGTIRTGFALSPDEARHVAALRRAAADQAEAKGAR